MRRWMLCAALILVVPMLACKFSADGRDETPEPASSPPSMEKPSKAPLPPTATVVPTAEATATPLPTAEPTVTPLPTATPAPGFGPISFSTEVDPATLECIAPTTVFPVGVTKVCACFEYWGMREDMEWPETWYFDGVEVSSETRKAEGSSVSATNCAFYSSGRALAAGNYELRLYFEGQLAQSGTFVIQ